MQAQAASNDQMKAAYSLIVPWSSLEQLLPDGRNACLVRQGYRGGASSDITQAAAGSVKTSWIRTRSHRGSR
jgi:hypothetical protein